MEDSLLADICLNMLPGIGPKKYESLVKFFGSSLQVFDAKFKDLIKCPGIGEIICEEILNWEKNYTPKEELERAQLAGVTILNRQHKDYPEAFLKLHHTLE